MVQAVFSRALWGMTGMEQVHFAIKTTLNISQLLTKMA